MGVRVWLYLFILDSADWETGIVYGWKDKDAADDMGMSARTLQDQRQHLENEGYISCKQVLHGQDITITNWTNPREYSGEVYNGTKKSAPSKKANGNTHGNINPIVKPRTPSYNSQTTESLAMIWESTTKYTITRFQGQELNALSDDWNEAKKDGKGDEVVGEAIREMCRLIDKPNLKYLRKIIDTWIAEGFKATKPELSFDEQLAKAGYDVN